MQCEVVITSAFEKRIISYANSYARLKFFGHFFTEKNITYEVENRILKSNEGKMKMLIRNTDLKTSKEQIERKIFDLVIQKLKSMGDEDLVDSLILEIKQSDFSHLF